MILYSQSNDILYTIYTRLIFTFMALDHDDDEVHVVECVSQGYDRYAVHEHEADEQQLQLNYRSNDLLDVLYDEFYWLYDEFHLQLPFQLLLQLLQLHLLLINGWMMKMNFHLNDHNVVEGNNYILHVVVVDNLKVDMLLVDNEIDKNLKVLHMAEHKLEEDS